MEDLEEFLPYRRAPYSEKRQSLIFPCGGAINDAGALAYIVLSGKSGRRMDSISFSPGSVRPIGRLISSSPGSNTRFRTARKWHIVPHRKRSNTILHLQEHANHRRGQGAWCISSRPGRYIVPSGKCRGSAISSRPGTYTVLSGKLCRSAREQTSSCRGRYIVLSGKVYRSARENLSSSSGNLTPVFPANRRFSFGEECERPVFVYVNCLLCFYGKRRILASGKGSSGGFPGRT
jgi:hypothetical protein